MYARYAWLIDQHPNKKFRYPPLYYKLMSKIKTISIWFMFLASLFAMGLGLLANDTWEVLAGFWMMMYITERIDKE